MDSTTLTLNPQQQQLTIVGVLKFNLLDLFWLISFIWFALISLVT